MMAGTVMQLKQAVCRGCIFERFPYPLSMGLLN